MSYHEGSNWQAKKEDEGKPLYPKELSKEEKELLRVGRIERGEKWPNEKHSPIDKQPEPVKDEGDITIKKDKIKEIACDFIWENNIDKSRSYQYLRQVYDNWFHSNKYYKPLSSPPEPDSKDQEGYWGEQWVLMAEKSKKQGKEIDYWKKRCEESLSMLSNIIKLKDGASSTQELFPLLQYITEISKTFNQWNGKE